MRGKLLIIFMLSLMIGSCRKDDMMQIPLQAPSAWATAKVAVVLPLSGEHSDKSRYERICAMFEENVIKAQINVAEGVKLELEWFDENSINIDKLAHDIYDREDIKAIIGPLNDDNVVKMANMMHDKDIPMFVMSSSETIARCYSCGTAGVMIKKPFLWSLSTTDITMSQIILAKIALMGFKNIAIVSANTKYGETFNRWIPYYANTMKFDMIDRAQYSTTTELENEIDRICESDVEAVVCAVQNTDDAKTVLQAVRSNPSAPMVYFTGSVLNSSLLDLGSLAEGVEGFSIYSSPDSGFHLGYQARFDDIPLPIEAQLYDSLLLSLVSFAYCHYYDQDISMNMALAELSDLPTATRGDSHTDHEATETPAWNYSGLRDIVLDPLRAGKQPVACLIGASGELKFAAEAYTSLVANNHINWLIYNGKPMILDYIDNYLSVWDWETTMNELDDRYGSIYKYKMSKGHKAVLICGSEGWYNYRHQADILHVYNSLKDRGFTDDDIILIMRDDIAYHPKNSDKGTIRVSPQGENLYRDIKLDYRADTLGVKDIEDILLGNKSSRLPIVLESTQADNVLLYWSGHGSDGAFCWLETDEKFTAAQLGDVVQKMYDNNRYQSMLICAEPCYSGSVVKAIEGVPLVLGISAADENESSYADNFNPELGVWMCDRFSHNMMRILENDASTNLANLYTMLNASTLGSHVQIYNSKKFYALNVSTLTDYFHYRTVYNK